MLPKQRKQCWMFHYTGKGIHEVKIVIGNHVTVYPCSETKEKTIRRAFTNMFGKLEFTRVEILLDTNDERQC